jgi:hypothetical protein
MDGTMLAASGGVTARNVVLVAGAAARTIRG